MRVIIVGNHTYVQGSECLTTPPSTTTASPKPPLCIRQTVLYERASRQVELRLSRRQRRHSIMHGAALVPDDVLDSPPPPPPPRLFERLRQIAGYTWDESKDPIHSSYDYWYVLPYVDCRHLA